MSPRGTDRFRGLISRVDANLKPKISVLRRVKKFQSLRLVGYDFLGKTLNIMSACSGARQKQVVAVLWRALALVGVWVGLVRAVPMIGNGSVTHMVTEMDMVSPAMGSELSPDGNHTLLLDVNNTFQPIHEPIMAQSKRAMCKCWNSTDEFLEEQHCRCEGSSIVRVPQKLTAMHKLTLEKVGIKRLRENALLVYANDLQDL